jgi:hypothetical protein
VMYHVQLIASSVSVSASDEGYGSSSSGSNTSQLGASSKC